jgi:transposase
VDAGGDSGIDPQGVWHSWLSIRGVGKYLARRAYTPQKTARRTYERHAPAVRNQGTVLFMIYPGGPSPQRLIVFMRRKTRGVERKVYLILDNLNVHKTKPVREWLAEQGHRIEVFYLPPYSPALNPSEYFNGDRTGEIQRRIPAKDITDLKRTVLGHSRRIRCAA